LSSRDPLSGLPLSVFILVNTDRSSLDRLIVFHVDHSNGNDTIPCAYPYRSAHLAKCEHDCRRQNNKSSQPNQRPTALPPKPDPKDTKNQEDRFCGKKADNGGGVPTYVAEEPKNDPEENHRDECGGPNTQERGTIDEWLVSGSSIG
jgi:hypothetical protein